MTIRDLIDKLKERPKTVDEYREQQKKEWLDAVEALFADVEAWLRPAEGEKVLSMIRSETEISEQDLGDYRAPVLEIRAGRHTARLEPVGPRVVGIIASGGRRHLGLRGRVDLVSGPVRVPLGRTATGAWKALPSHGEPREVTEESFVQILGAVLLGSPDLDDKDRREAFLERLATGLRARGLELASATFGRAAGNLPVWMVTLRTAGGGVVTKQVDLSAGIDPDAAETCDEVVDRVAAEMS
ncbi:hypothetical protein WMF37_29875 [Sorangium sp. So ce291]|uniref:hypothetical protein n=1 Tax=Sorangium sp. So ce291 TaxID=3133294 RepID=UPI003F5FCE4F